MVAIFGFLYFSFLTLRVCFTNSQHWNEQSFLVACKQMHSVPVWALPQHAHLVTGCVLFLIWLSASNHAAGPKDTPIELVLEKTYDDKAGIGMPDL